MGHLAVSGSRPDESSWQKAGEEQGDAADAHQNSKSSRPEPPSGSDPHPRRERSEVPTWSIRAREGFSWIIRLRRKCTAFADSCTCFSLISLLALTALKHLGWPEMMPFKIRSLYSVCKWVGRSLVELPCMINYPKTAINIFSPLFRGSCKKKKKRPQWPWWQSKHLAGGVVTNHSDITKGWFPVCFRTDFLDKQEKEQNSFPFFSFLLF